MVWVKLYQVRMSDKAVVFEFYNSKDDSEAFGSRGVNAGRDFDEKLFDEMLSGMTLIDFFKLKTEGFELPDQPETAVEKIARIAYEQYLKAKESEEAEKEQVLS